MGKLFGTDGVRGIANVELTASLAYRLGRAGAYVLTKELNHKPKILIGTDTRISKDMLEAALVAGICSVGATATCVGVLPTPGIAYLVKKHDFDAGAVISASHNPMEDNGIKFFGSKGYKLPDEIEGEIERYILECQDEVVSPKGEDIGQKRDYPNGVYEYMEYLKKTVTMSFKGLKVGLDCANGSSYKCAPAVFTDLGADVYVIHNEPDGKNINKNCGSTHTQDLQQFVVDNKLDLGIAFDGDADRLICVDENGKEIDGDGILAILAKSLSSKAQLEGNGFVATVMSNLGMNIFANENGYNFEQSDVGDRYVLERMLDLGYILGGEQSGHIIMLNYSTTGDGILSALQIVNYMVEKGKRMSQLGSLVTVYPQVMINANVPNELKYKYMDIPEIKSEIDLLNEKFKGEGRVLIRPSGTQPMVRVMIEGKDKDAIKAEAERMVKLIEKYMQ